MVHYELCNLHIGDCTVKEECIPVSSHLAIVEEESMTFYKLDDLEDMKKICDLLNGK